LHDCKSGIALRHINRNDDYLVAKSYNTIAATLKPIIQLIKPFFIIKGLAYADKSSNDNDQEFNNNIGNILLLS
jgi:hypothetical protein